MKQKGKDIDGLIIFGLMLLAVNSFHAFCVYALVVTVLNDPDGGILR